MSDADKKAEALMQGLQREQCYLIMMRPAENPGSPPKASNRASAPCASAGIAPGDGEGHEGAHEADRHGADD